MASSALFVSSADHSSPVNTGVFLVKPRQFLYVDAIKLLHYCQWSNKTGFNEAGDPAFLWNDPKQLDRLSAGFGTLDRVHHKMKRTDFVKKRTWLFVGGNIDQGKPPRQTSYQLHVSLISLLPCSQASSGTCFT